MSGAQGGPPPWVTAAGGGPPPAIASLLAGSASWGANGPPSSVLAQLNAFGNAAPATPTVTGSSLATSIPTVLSGPPSGFSIPAGATGPPAGFSIPTGSAGPPPGIASLIGNGSVRDFNMSMEQSRALMSVTCILLGLCLVAVVGRLLARKLQRMRIEADDWTCVATFFMFLALCVIQLITCHYSLRMAEIFPPSLAILRKLGQLHFASSIAYDFVTCAVKLSLLMLYRRIFTLRATWFKIMWYINVVVVVVYFIVLIVLQTTACKPLSAEWDDLGRCLPDLNQMAGIGFLNAAIDISVLILPIRMVWSLHLSRSRKIGICSVFALGLIAVAVSIARAVSIAKHELFKSGGFSLVLWSTVEPAAAYICSCLPVLRPLYTHGIAKLGPRMHWSWYASKRSHGSSDPSQEKSNYTGTTLRSDVTAKNLDEKSWLKVPDPEMAIKPVAEDSSDTMSPVSPISPLDKPLPPAYAPNVEGDTGYHTWSWNLLSRPRDEHHAPTLTRSPIIQETGSPWRDPNPGATSPRPSQSHSRSSSILARSLARASGQFGRPKQAATVSPEPYEPVRPIRQDLTISSPSRGTAKNSLGIRINSPTSPDTRRERSSINRERSSRDLWATTRVESDSSGSSGHMTSNEINKERREAAAIPKLSIRTALPPPGQDRCWSPPPSDEGPSSAPAPLSSHATHPSITSRGRITPTRTNHVSDLAMSPSKAARAQGGHNTQVAQTWGRSSTDESRAGAVTPGIARTGSRSSQQGGQRSLRASLVTVGSRPQGPGVPQGWS